MHDQRVATTTSHHHTEKHSLDTCQPLYSPRPAKREGREGGVRQTTAQMQDLELKIAQLPRASTRHLKFGKNPYVNQGRMIYKRC